MDSIIAVLREHFPEILEYCRENPFTAFLYAVLVVTLLLLFILYHGFEIAEVLKRIYKRRRGRSLLYLGSALPVVLSVWFVWFVPPSYEPVPEFARNLASVIVGDDDIVLNWSYARDSDGTGRYIVQRATNREFTENVVTETVNEPSYRQKSPGNGDRYWRVRYLSSAPERGIRWAKNLFKAVFLGNAVAANDYRWSKPFKTTHYESSLDRIQKTRTVVVGINKKDELGIFRYNDAKGDYAGFDIGLIKYIVSRLSGADKNGGKLLPSLAANGPLRIEWRALQWRDERNAPNDKGQGPLHYPLLSAPMNGKADIVISTISRLQRREQEFQIAFSKPYFCTTQAIVYRASEKVPDKLPAIEDIMRSERVGVQGETTSLFLFQELAKQMPNFARSDPQTFDTLQRVLDELARNNISYVITDTPFAISAVNGKWAGGTKLQYYELKQTDFANLAAFKMPYDEYAIAVRSGDKELLAAIDKIIDELQEPPARQLRAIYDEAAKGFYHGAVPANEEAAGKHWKCPG